MSVYTAKSYEHLLGLRGFSDNLLTNHFGLYNGYVTNTNLLIEKIGGAEVGTPGHAELQRRMGWEWNGMRMHELYFSNMTKDETSLNEGSDLLQKIEDVYGSLEAWKDDFQAVGKMRGVGWVVLFYDKESGELFNNWIAEHDGGHFTGATPLLVMDVWEHAFVLDYGVDRASYIGAFMEAIDWRVAQERFNA